MAQLDKTTYEGTYNSGSVGLFKDNTTNDIEATDLRSLVTDTKDSFLNKTDEAYTGVFPQFTTTTSTTAYVGTPSPVITAYATGQKFQVKVHATSTGAATLNLNALGAKKIYTDPTTQATTDDLLINQIYIFFYDAALDSASGGFLMVGGSGGGGTPGGSDTYVQYNDGGSFGGDAGMTYNETTNILTVGGAIYTSSSLTDASSIALTGARHTLTTDEATITFTISYTGDKIVMEVTLNAVDAIYTFPAATLCVTEGIASGDNTMEISGVTGDRYLIEIEKMGSNYYATSKRFGQ